MANCPNCGSEHIQLTKDTNVDWGRAAAGYLLFGKAGGVVGAVTGGDERNSVVCLNCGTSWKPADLHNILLMVKRIMRIDLNLSREPDRRFLNDFVNQMIPYLKSFSRIEKEANDKIKIAQGETIAGQTFGYTICFFITIMILFSAIDYGWNGFCSFLLLIAIISVGLGYLHDKLNKVSIHKQLSKIKLESNKTKLQAEENLKWKIIHFITSHPL